MKSLMFLWRCLADELAGRCHTSAALDYKKLKSRVEHEGTSFLTITLPSFSKAFEASLEEGYWDPSRLTGFRYSGGLPLFLGGFLDRVFDKETGRLLMFPDVESIFAIRQLTLMFKKIELPCTSAREARAMDGYISCEQEVAAWQWYSGEQRESFIRMAMLLFSDVLDSLETTLYKGELRPKHGPGKTADRLVGNKKYRQVEWPVRLEEVFSYIEYALPNHRYHSEVEGVTFLEPEAERPVKVVSVPKTLDKPRIIAQEPTCMQFMQQAISKALVQELETLRIRGQNRNNVCYEFVGFTHQDPNRIMAREGSLNGELATLDLSEASDRVANQHVIALLSRYPHLGEAVQAVRSTKADVRGHGVIPLAKYASMGSALTFPLEAMVFLTIVFMALERSAKRQFTRKDIKSYRGKVRVYGDDIIVPSDGVHSVITELESFGLKVNSNKSFWNGKFRESCGGDYYNGAWVTPIYVRRRFPRSRDDVSEIESLVAVRNQLYQAGLWTTAGYLDRLIERDYLPDFPAVSDGSILLGRYSFLGYTGNRMCPQLHRPLVKGSVAQRKPPRSEIDGVWALLKCLSKPPRGDHWTELLFPLDVDKKHLQRAGRPRSASIMTSWKTPY